MEKMLKIVAFTIKKKKRKSTKLINSFISTEYFDIHNFPCTPVGSKKIRGLDTGIRQHKPQIYIIITSMLPKEVNQVHIIA